MASDPDNFVMDPDQGLTSWNSKDGSGSRLHNEQTEKKKILQSHTNILCYFGSLEFLDIDQIDS